MQCGQEMHTAQPTSSEGRTFSLTQLLPVWPFLKKKKEKHRGDRRDAASTPVSSIQVRWTDICVM